MRRDDKRLRGFVGRFVDVAFRGGVFRDRFIVLRRSSNVVETYIVESVLVRR